MTQSNHLQIRIVYLLILVLSTSCNMGNKNINSLTRNELPISVSDETWKIIDGLQKENDIHIKIDPYRQNGAVSENVLAQFEFNPARFETGIYIYDIDALDESILVHELLHANLIIKGYPYFFSNTNLERKSKLIQNLENVLQHFYVFNELDKMKLLKRDEIKREWYSSINSIRDFLEKDPPPLKLRKYIYDKMRIIYALDAIVRGIDRSSIVSYLPLPLKGELDTSIDIYNELKKCDFLKSDDVFKLHMKVAQIMDIASDSIAISKLDFGERKRNYYNALNGQLLSSQ